MPETVHIVVESGPNKGKSVTVPPEGARLGRSSKNDIVIVDPLLSRHHCRFFWKTDAGLWVSDLGSANQTMVNGQPIQETALQPNDRIELGDTVLKVINNGIASASETPTPAPVVDLGFSSEAGTAQPRKSIGKWPLITLAVLVLGLAAAAWLPSLIKFDTGVPVTPPVEPKKDLTLEVNYEKVKANTNNIFRYNARITRDRMLYIEIDDLKTGRRVRKDARLEEDYVKDLAQSIADTGFFGLKDEYEGLQPDTYESWDLSVTVGRDTGRTVVRDRLEPPVFQEVRQIIEECARNELGIWAMQFTQDELKSMAREAYLQGKKLYDEQEVAIDNLSKAIDNLQEAELYLETVEPKPDFYDDLVVLLKDSEAELQKKYENQNFRAQKAMRLKNWEEAATELRILLELIPDRSDPRNRKARKQLIEAERRISRND